MSKLLDLYDNCRKGQELVEDLAYSPPKNFSIDDAKTLAELSDTLELFQKLILDAISEEVQSG